MRRSRIKKTGVFNHNDMYYIKNAIATLARRAIGLHQIQFAVEDFYSLFVKPEDRVVFERAQELLAFGYSRPESFSVPWRGLRLDVALYAKSLCAPFLATVREDAPKELLDKVDDWVRTRLEIGLNYGRVNALVDTLNTKCKQPEQVRFFFPSILTLLIMNQDTRHWAESLSEFKQPAYIPNVGIPREVTLKAAGTIAGAQLLPEGEHEWKSPMTLSMPDRAAKIQEPGIGWIYSI